MRRLVALLLLIAAPAAIAQDRVSFTAAETTRILQHGPWPAAWSPDKSNAVSGSPAAAVFGERLFFAERLSSQGAVSCASCHMPDKAWADGRARSLGHGRVDRNAPTLLNVRLNRWFGWDGAGDSLWAQSIRPILDGREMAADASHVADLVRRDPTLACHYQRVFGDPAGKSDETMLVDAAKALAAFQETLSSGRTPFDEFRDALAGNDAIGQALYPVAAQRGLKLFVGRGNCSTCHFGPNFTNGEFHDIGIPFFAEPGRVDTGRYDGLRRLQASSFNRLGRYNDDPSGTTSLATRHVVLQHRNFGEFKVPSLRNVAQTAPYMHAGSHATLIDAVRHYSELDENRLHADGERLLRPLRLSGDEIADLVAFLETLSAPQQSFVPHPAACP